MPSFTSNGVGDTFIVGNSGDQGWIHGDGTWGGGTITWEFLGTDENWHPFADGVFTANFDQSLPVAKGLSIRPTLTGAAGPNIYYQAM